MPLGMPSFKPTYSSGGNWASKFGVPSPTEAARKAPGVGAVGMSGLQQGLLSQVAPTAPSASQLLDQWNQAQQYYTSYFAPDAANLQNQFQNLVGRRDALNADYNSNVNLTKARYDLLQQQLAQQQAVSGVDMDAAIRQMSLADQLLGLLGGKKDQALNYTNALSGLSNQMFDVTKQQLDLKEKGTKRGSERAQAKALSDAIARGAVVTPGFNADQQFLRDELTDALTGITGERTAANISFEQDKAGFTNQTKNILLDFDTASLNNREQKAQAQDRMKQLEIQAKNFNIEKNKLANDLQSALQRLNMDRSMSVSQVLEWMGSNNAAQRSLAMQIMDAATRNQSQFPMGSGGANLSWGPGGTPTPTARSQPQRSNTGNARQYAR